MQVAKEGLDVLFVDLPDMHAAPGSIFVEADAGYREDVESHVNEGRLVARAGARINVFNETPFSMTVGDTMIRDTRRATVVDGEYTVLTPGDVYFNNKGLTLAQDPPAKTITITQDSISRNGSDYDLELDIVEELSQDIYVLGDIVNEVGDVSIINNEGSINVSREIRAQKVNINAAEDFNLNTEGWFHNRDPRQYPGLDDFRQQVHSPDGKLTTDSYSANPFFVGGELVATFDNPLPVDFDEFGRSVAVSGDMVVVGAPGADIESEEDAGAAYLFDATTGALLWELASPEPQARAYFGLSVAVSGNTVVVGVPYYDEDGAVDSGVVYVFNGATGEDLVTLNNPNPQEKAYFGNSVAVSGNTVVVGAPNADGGEVDLGAAYVFDLTNGGVAPRTLNGPASGSALFGVSVAVWEDTIVVGASGADDDAANAGAAYVFDATAGAHHFTLVSPEPQQNAFFGSSAAVSADTVVVGAPSQDGASGRDSGAAYVFAAAEGEHRFTLVSPEPQPNGHFGKSVAVSGDTVAVGAPDFDSPDAAYSGEVYLFSAATGDLLRTLRNPAPTFGDNFGRCVSAQENTVVVGAPGQDTGGRLAGKAYVFGDASNSAVLAQERVDVTARFLNINGLIQSGVQTITLHVDESFVAPPATSSLLDDDGNPLPGISFGEDGVPVDGYFDAEKQAIVVDEIVPKGGAIVLAGQILSTGNGELRAAHGYASVDVDNQSPYDLILTRIDTTKKRNGTITITDTARLQKVEYVVDGEQVTETIYQGAPGEDDSSGSDGTTPGIVYELVSSQNHGLTDPMFYQPREGLQYVWTEGQEKSQVVTTKYEKKSFNLIGFDWDGLVRDASYKWQVTEIRNEFPLLESEVLAAVPDYDLDALDPDTQVTLEPGQIVKDSQDNLYRYQGATETDFNLELADFSDSSKWVSEIGIPDYATGYAYTIQYVMSDDTDVELIPNVDIVKVVNDDNGVMAAADGEVGHRYLYVGNDPMEVVLSEQNFFTDQWEDVTDSTTDDNVTYLSSFENYTSEEKTWTTGGGWLRKKTYHTLTTQSFGQKDYYTHTLKADYPIAISFIEGPATPSINISTARDVYLQETVTSPSDGAISVTSAEGDVIFSDTAAILGASPDIQAGGSVRANVEGARESNGTVLAASPGVQNDPQVLNITSAGDIEIRVVFDPAGNQSSTIGVGQIISTGGNVILHAGDGIQAHDASSLISGNQIELDAGNGGVGTDLRPLRVDSDLHGSGGVAAIASGNIYIRETDGDLKLTQPQAWENVEASIQSVEGDVYLYVDSGAILDAFHEEFKPRTQEETDELDQKMQLSGEGARHAAETAIRSEEGRQTQLYHDYWRKYRDVRPSGLPREIMIESVDKANDEIRLSQPHGLQTGDEVFFGAGVNLNSQDFEDLGKWEEIELYSGGLMDLVEGQIVRIVNTDDTVESLYRYVGEVAQNVDLSAADFGDISRWVEIFPEYSLFADYETSAGTVTLHQGQQVRADDGRLYRYLGVDLSGEDFGDSVRWEKIAPDHDLEVLPPGTLVNLQTGQIVITAEGVLYRYLRENVDEVELNTQDFGDSDTWETITHYDLETPLPSVDLQQGQIARTAEGDLYLYLVSDTDLSTEEFSDSSRWVEISIASGAPVKTTTGMLVRTADGGLYRYVGENVTETNLSEGFAYYAVVTSPTTLQLATSRYDTVIREIPVTVDITIEQVGGFGSLRLLEYGYVSGALRTVNGPGEIGPQGGNTITRTDGQRWDDHFAVGQFIKVVVVAGGVDLGTFAIEEIRDDGSTLVLTGASFSGSNSVTVTDAQWENLRHIDETYGDSDYDPNFIFHLTQEERQERIEARSLSSALLSSHVASSLFDFLYPAAASGGSSQGGAEQPNVLGQRITLVASAGKIGRVEGARSIDLSGRFENLSGIERQVLAITTRDDVVAVNYVVYRYNGADGEVDLLKTDFRRRSLWEQQSPDYTTSGQTQWQWLEIGDLVQIAIPQGIDGQPQFGVYQYQGDVGLRDLSQQDWNSDDWVSLAQHDMAEGKKTLTHGDYVGRTEGVTVEVWNDVDVQTQSGLAIMAQGAVSIGSPGDLHVDSITAGGAVRLLADGSIDATGQLAVAELDVKAGRDIRLTQLNGPLIISGATAIQGCIELAVLDTESPDDKLIVTSEATVSAANESVMLLAGDEVLISPRSQIVAETWVLIAGDQQDVDPGAGARIEILGHVDAPTLTVTGGEDSDTFTLTNVTQGNTVEVLAGSGDDQVQVGDKLGDIAGQLILDGGGGNDRLILRDDHDGQSRPRQAGRVESNRISGFGMPLGAWIEYRGFDDITAGPGLEMTLSDDDGYEVTVLDTAVWTELAFGTGDDKVIFDNKAQHAPVLGATLQSEDRDGDGGHETLRVSKVGPMVGDVYLTNVDDVTVDLGAASDQLQIDLSTAGVWIGVQGHGGDDQIVVKNVGYYTYVDGGPGADEVKVDILGDPTDNKYNALWDFLAYTTETLTVDNSLTESNGPNLHQVQWKIQRKNGVLFAQEDPILRTDGVDEIHLIAGDSSGSTLEVEELDGTVNVVGNRIEMSASGPVLHPSDFINDGFTTTLGTLAAVADVASFGDFVYTASPGDDTVAMFRDVGAGQLELRQVFKERYDGIDSLDGASRLVISDDGRFVYVGASEDNALTAFRRDAASGQLEFLQSVFDNGDLADGLRGVTDIAIHGDSLYVAGAGDDDLGVFARGSDGQLAFTGGLSGLTGLSSVTVSHDGTRLYTIAANGTVSVFARTASGDLTFLFDLVGGQPVGSSFPANLSSNNTGFPDERFTGPPDDVDARNLPADSVITFDFGDNQIPDGPRVYFNVYELDWGGPEFTSIKVEVSAAGANFQDVTSTEGPALSIPGDEMHGNSAFARSYAAAGTGIRYLRITTVAAGFDLDAVGAVVLAGTSDTAEVVSGDKRILYVASDHSSTLQVFDVSSAEGYSRLNDLDTGIENVRAIEAEVRQLPPPDLVEQFVSEVADWTDQENPYADRWRVVDQGTLGAPSHWSVSEGILRQDSNIYGPTGSATSDRQGTYLYYGDDEGESYQWRDYELEVGLRSADDDGIGVLFRYTDRDNYYKLEMDHQRSFLKLFKIEDGVETTLRWNSYQYPRDAWFNVEIRTVGSEIQVWVDDVEIWSLTDPSALSQGTVAMYCWGQEGAEFRNVQVRSAPGIVQQQFSTINVLGQNAVGKYKVDSDSLSLTTINTATFDGTDPVRLHAAEDKVYVADAGANALRVFNTVFANHDVAFQSPVSFATGESPRSVAMADLNADGIRDLVTANYWSDDVSVLLGRGDATFHPGVSFAAGRRPSSVAVADLNGDKRLDVVIANENSDNVSVLLGKGDGTFHPGVSFAVGRGPGSVAVADLNRDGRLDLVTANRWTDNVSVLLGESGATYQPALNFPVGSAEEVLPGSVAVADLNGDGLLDVVTANRLSQDVSVLLNKGDDSGTLTFEQAVNLAAGDLPSSVAAADVDGDGSTDLVIANQQLNRVSVMLNNGNGTFQPAVSFATGEGPYSVAVADLSGDDRLDIITANWQSNDVSVLRGSGDGTFEEAENFAAGGSARSLAMADLTGDGVLDLVTTTWEGNVALLLGEGSFAFGPMVSTDAEAARLTERPLVLSGLQSVEVSPDSRFVYAVDPRSNALVAVGIDEQGALSRVESVIDTNFLKDRLVLGLRGASQVVINPKHEDLYVLSPEDEAVAVFARDNSSGKLTFLQELNIGPGATGLIPSPHGQHVYSSGPGMLQAWSRQPDGQLGTIPTEYPITDADDFIIQAAIPNEDDTLIFLTSNSLGTVRVLSADAAGDMSFVQEITGIAEPSDLALSSDGEFLFITGTGDGSLHVAKREDGTYSVVQTLLTGFNGVHGSEGANRVALSPDGAYVYVTGGVCDNMAVFQQDATSGKLQFVQAVRHWGDWGLKSPNSVAVSSHGTVIVGSSEGVRGNAGGIATFNWAAQLPPAVSFENVAELTITAGDGADYLTVENLDVNTAATIDVAGGDDFVQIYGPQVAGPVSVDGGTGDNDVFAFVRQQYDTDPAEGGPVSPDQHAIYLMDDDGGQIGPAHSFKNFEYLNLLTLPPVVQVDPRVTNDPTPELTGTIDDPTASIQVVIGGSSFTATNNSDGTWTLAAGVITPALVDGVYDIVATATNDSGNVGTDATTDELVVDTTRPTSRVESLPRTATNLSFDVSVTGRDLAAGLSGVASGVNFFDVYLSVDNNPFTLWKTLVASQPTATFVAESNHLYGFRGVAHDAAGNVERKPASVEAAIYVPDLNAPETAVIAVDTATPTFVVDFEGTDSGGAGLNYADVFVQVDDGPVQHLGSVAAGTPDLDGLYRGSIHYQAIADSGQHSYRFYTRGEDGAGNVEAAPATSTDDMVVTAAFPQPVSVQPSNFDVQKGAIQRSYIRFLDVMFNSGFGLQELIDTVNDADNANDRIRLQRFGLDGSGPGVTMDLSGLVRANGQSMSLDFGSQGIAGNRNSPIGNGYYDLAFDLDGDGSFETDFHFHRLFGDTNGDRIVDSLDEKAIVAAFGRTGPTLDADVNGDGYVNALDRLFALKNLGQLLTPSLPLDD